jgi:hypothetical protein
MLCSHVLELFEVGHYEELIIYVCPNVYALGISPPSS